MDGRRLPVTPRHGLPAVGLGILLGVAFGWAVDRNAPEPVTAAVVRTVAATATAPSAGNGSAPPPALPPASTTKRPAGGTTARPPDRKLAAALTAALTAGMRNQPGTIQAAVMMDNWGAPATAGTRIGDSMRPWSMVKAVTATTLLRLRRGSTQGVDEPLTRALTHSDNCAQRALTVQLERQLGGQLSTARAAIRDTLRLAGGDIDVDVAQQNADGQYCITPSYKGLPAADAHYPALLLGTTHWHVRDAIRFIHALRARTVFGTTASDAVLAKLRLPKRNSQEPGAEQQLTAAPAWGAGTVFAAGCWKVAYKAGWGGHAQGRFLAGQMGTVELPGGRWIAFAVMFHPTAQPPSDDPGVAKANTAVEAVLGALKAALRRQFGGSCA
jgi:hypothetical protein